VELRATRNIRKSYPIIEANVVSTIGAGDNFNAGFIYGLLRYGITREALDRGIPARIWDKIIHWAQMYSANCCQSISTSVSVEFGAEMARDAEGERDTYLEW
jgi:fructokinase